MKMNDIKQELLSIEEKKDKYHGAFKSHTVTEYVTDANGAQKIAEAIVGSSVKQSTIHFAAKRETEVREENGKSPCFLVARSVAFFDISWVKDWAKRLKAKRDAEKVQVEKDIKDAKIDAISKQMMELQRQLAELKKADK